MQGQIRKARGHGSFRGVLFFSLTATAAYCTLVHKVESKRVSIHRFICSWRSGGAMEEYSFANSSALDFPVNVRMLVLESGPVDLLC